jgi:small GTP-binding protein
MANNKNAELNYSLITLGNSGVGKTSIFRRFTYNLFDESNISTIGLSFLFKDLTLNNKKKVKLRLVDTAGQEKYKSLAKSYFKNAEGVLFVFDLNNLESFNNIRDWIKLYEENNKDNKKIVKYLIGNKDDLESEVPKESIDELIKETKFKYISTSAKTGNNIEILFKEMSEQLYLYNHDSGNKEQKNFSIENKDKNDPSKDKESDCICVV